MQLQERQSHLGKRRAVTRWVRTSFWSSAIRNSRQPNRRPDAALTPNPPPSLPMSGTRCLKRGRLSPCLRTQRAVGGGDFACVC